VNRCRISISHAARASRIDMSKMNPQEFEARVAHIHAQWEASREPTSTLDDGDRWHTEQLRRLYEESGWSQEEIDAWIAGREERAAELGSDLAG
jgi:hypothetical protein